jgi:hypothetical protein
VRRRRRRIPKPGTSRFRPPGDIYTDWDIDQLAGKILHGLQIPCPVEDALPGRMAGFVHPLARGRTCWNDAETLLETVPEDATESFPL